VSRHYDHVLRPADLKATQFTILNLLAAGGASTMASLASRLAMERTTLLRNLAPLQRRGLVQIEGSGRPHPVKISLSAAGRCKLESAIPLWERAQASLRSGMDTISFQNALEAFEQISQLQS
jgi:DNA-binding MarR family transcriptional regulator